MTSVAQNCSFKLLKVAVIGASGFLGGHIFRRLLNEDGVHAVGYSRSNKPGLLALDECWRDIQSFDVIVNAVVDYGRNGNHLAYEANLSFPLRLISEMKSRGADSTFVNLDSFFGKFSIPFYSPLRSYSLSKSLLPMVAKDLLDEPPSRGSHRSNVRFLNLRIEHVFGPGDSHGKFVPWLVSEMIAKSSSIELTAGLQMRDFIYVDDAADLIVRAIRAADLLDTEKNLEVGTGEMTSVRSFVESLAAQLGFNGRLDFGARQPPPGEIQASFADPYLRNRLGVSAFDSPGEGIAKLLRPHL